MVTSPVFQESRFQNGLFPNLFHLPSQEKKIAWATSLSPPPQTPWYSAGNIQEECYAWDLGPHGFRVAVTPGTSSISELLPRETLFVNCWVRGAKTGISPQLAVMNKPQFATSLPGFLGLSSFFPSRLFFFWASGGQDTVSHAFLHSLILKGSLQRTLNACFFWDSNFKTQYPNSEFIFRN